MKTSPHFEISSWQLTYFLIGTIIGTVYISLPRLVISESEHDAWISVFLGAVIPSISTLLIVKVGALFPDLSFGEKAKLLLGKYLGLCFMLAYMAYMGFWAAMVAQSITQITKVYILPQTPPRVILSIVLLTSMYVSFQKTKVIARVHQILFAFLLIKIALTLFSVVKADFKNLLPIGSTSWDKILKGIIITGSAYAGNEILFTIYPLVKDKKKVLKYCYKAIFIIMAIYLTVTILSTVVLGVEYAKKTVWPTAALLSVVDIPVIERLELIFLVLWMGIAIRPVISFSHAVVMGIIDIWGAKSENYYQLIVLFVYICLFALGAIPQDMFHIFTLVDYLNYLYYLISFGFPIVFLTAYYLRKGQMKGNG